jgi:hypothetical protein
MHLNRDADCYGTDAVASGAAHGDPIKRLPEHSRPERKRSGGRLASNLIALTRFAISVRVILL